MLTKHHFDGLQSMDEVLDISPMDFEYFSKFFLESLGYQNVFVTHKYGMRGADGGVDLECKLNEQKYYVQCKRWRFGFEGNMKVAPVRELGGCMWRDRVEQGIFISTLDYDSGTRSEADKMRINLIGRQEIADQMRRLNPKFTLRRSFWRWVLHGLIDFLKFFFRV